MFKPYHADGWTADFRFDARLLEPGRYPSAPSASACAIGITTYGPSPSVRVTVR